MNTVEVSFATLETHEEIRKQRESFGMVIGEVEMRRDLTVEGTCKPEESTHEQ